MKEIILSAMFVGTMLASAFAQFEGTYSITVKDEKRPAPMEMNITVKGDMSVIEIPSLKDRGMSKTIYNNADHTMIMLMDREGNKMAMKQNMQDARQTINTTEEPKITVTKETKTIDGHKCTKVIVTSKDATTEMWMTDETGLTMKDFMTAFSGRNTRMVSQQMPRSFGDLTGISLETSSKNNVTAQTTVITLSKIKAEKVDDKVFSIEGYNLMDMPAGGGPPPQHGTPPPGK